MFNVKCLMQVGIDLVHEPDQHYITPAACGLIN